MTRKLHILKANKECAGVLSLDSQVVESADVTCRLCFVITDLIADSGSGPAQASADLGDVIVVAHEKLFIVHVVDVVGVDNALLVCAG